MVDGAPGAKQKLKVSSQHDHHPPDSVFASAAPPKFNHGKKIKYCSLTFCSDVFQFLSYN